MIRNLKVTAVAVVTLALSALMVSPAAAQTSRQRDKNTMRNVAIGLGALAAHQAITGKTTNAIVLGAGAAYAGKKYEDARKAQSREENRYGWRSRNSRFARR